MREKEIFGEIFTEKDVDNVVYFDRCLTLKEQIAQARAILEDDMLLTVTREGDEEEVIVGDIFDRVLDGMLIGSASELYHDGHPKILRRIADRHK